jgi:hypothetical protein
MYPPRRGTFDLLQNVTKPMSGSQSNKKVDVIIDATNAFGNATEGTNNASELRVQLLAPLFRNLPQSVLGAEYKVIVKTQVG